MLHDGVERHGIEPAKEGDEEQVRTHAPALQVSEEGCDRIVRCSDKRGVDGSGREIEIEQEYRHHDGGDGHVARRDFTLQQRIGQQ